jgi:Galactose oxidase, central domain/Kelch motif
VRTVWRTAVAAYSRGMRRRIALLAVAVGLAGCSSAVETPAESRFIVLDPVVERAAHTATPLLDGRVLVAGGCVIDGCGEATDTSEVFDAEAETFTLAAPMTTRRSGHSATMLPNGNVLLVGGYSGEGQPPLASADLYDAASGTFVHAGSMSVGRGAHAAALLPDGRVLVVGGWVRSRTFTNTTEIWDPTTRGFTPASPLGMSRGGATATSLASGEVLLVGGENPPAVGLRSTEIYDPVGGRWRPGPELAVPRFKHATATTGEGEVLVLGGTSDDVNLMATVERFDGGSFQPAGMLTEGRYKFSDAVVVLPDGRLLVAGGGRRPEVYDPAAARGTTVDGVPTARTSFATATLLRDSGVLVVGGYDETIDLRRDAYVLRP